MASDAYESAKFLLEHSSMAHLLDSKVVNDATERIDFDELQGCALSSGEQVIVEAAVSLFNGNACCPLGEAIRTLDDANYVALVRAMELRRKDAFTTNLIGAS